MTNKYLTHGMLLVKNNTLGVSTKERGNINLEKIHVPVIGEERYMYIYAIQKIKTGRGVGVGCI